MKNRTILLVTGLALSIIPQLQAQITIYAQDFSTDPGFTRPPVDSGAINNVDFYYAATDVGDPLVPNVVPGQFFGGTQPGTAESLLVSTSGGLLQTSGAAGGDRGRGFSVIIDTSVATPGAYNVSFVISNITFPNGGAATEESLSFSVFEGRGITGDGTLNNVLIDNSRNNSNGETPHSAQKVTGTAKAPPISTGNALTSNGTFSLDFTLTEAGDEGDYLMLNWWVWSEATEPVSTDLPSFALDDIVVQTVVPEPSTFALVSGFIALGLILIRRRNR